MRIATAPDEMCGPDMWATSSVETRIKQLAYLRKPDAIRAAINNQTGSTVPIPLIERTLKKLDRMHKPLTIGEPTDFDGYDYAPRKYPHRNACYPSTSVREMTAEEHRKRLQDEIDKRRAKIEEDMADLRRASRSLPFSQKLAFEVADELGLKLEKVLSGSRSRECVEARALIYILLREKDPLKYSYPHIGRLMGGKDHSTIIHSIREFFPVFCKRNPLLFPLYRALGGKVANPSALA